MEEEGQLGSDRVCSVNTDSWSLPPGGSTCEFAAEPRAMMGPHCQLSLPSALSSSLSTDDNSTCTRAGSRGRHARWSKGVARRGLPHTVLEICFIKCVRQMSSPLNPFPSGLSMSPSFPVILLQSSSQPNLYLLPSLLDNFFFSCNIQILPFPYFEERLPTTSWSWGISLVPSPGGSLLLQSKFIKAGVSVGSSPCERLPQAAQIPSFRVCLLGAFRVLGPSSGKQNR